LEKNLVFTARCYPERMQYIDKSSFRPSIRDVVVSRSRKLEFFENNVTVSC